MKNLLLVILMAAATIMCAQNNGAASILTSMHLQPDFKQMSGFKAGVKSYYDFLDKEDLHGGGMWRIENGPRAGDYLLLGGTNAIGDFDKEQSRKQRRALEQTVYEYLNDIGPIEFWNKREEFSKPLSPVRPIFMVYFLKISPGKISKVNTVLEKMWKAVETVEGEFNFGVYENEFRQGSTGWHFVIGGDFGSWTELENDKRMYLAFEKLYGEGAFKKWVAEFNDVFDDGYQEIWTYVGI